MTILEALQKTVEAIRIWVEAKFIQKTDVDSILSSTSENPVQNKVIDKEINSLKQQIGKIDVSEQIEKAIDEIDYPVDSVNGYSGAVKLTADDFGIYVQDTEPINAIDGDIWVDMANDPTEIQVNIPDALPNPNALIITGAVEATYDGSSYTEIEIPITPSKISELDNDSGFITGYVETDPTVPSWAKESTKPKYTKSEVGLGNVDNVKQYSVSNPPPYPVTSVNGKTGAVTISGLPTVTSSDNGKVLMVVNGSWQVVDLNISIDANGVVSV